MLAIDQVHAASLYRMGLTVQFEDIAPFVAATAPDLRLLEAELGVARGSARASVFSSPLADGLSVHFDAQDLGFSPRRQRLCRGRLLVFRLSSLAFRCGLGCRRRTFS